MRILLIFITSTLGVHVLSSEALIPQENVHLTALEDSTPAPGKRNKRGSPLPKINLSSGSSREMPPELADFFRRAYHSPGERKVKIQCWVDFQSHFLFLWSINFEHWFQFWKTLGLCFYYPSPHHIDITFTSYKWMRSSDAIKSWDFSWSTAAFKDCMHAYCVRSVYFKSELEAFMNFWWTGQDACLTRFKCMLLQQLNALIIKVSSGSM